MRQIRDRPHPDVLIARIAERQHGVIDLDQLRDAGLRNGAINLRVRTGRLHRLHTRVFAVGHTRLTREGHWLAAVLALGDGALLSHVSAAALWGLRPSSAARIHVTVPTSAGHRHRGLIVVHRSRALTAADIRRRDAMLAPGPLQRAVEQSLLLRLFDLHAVNAVIAANTTRAGATTLARIVSSLHDEPPLTRSKLEALMRDLCDAHAIPRPEVNAILEGEEVDFLWRAQRLVVETDGHESHGTRAAFERDRAKDARLTLLGYRVVRFTYRRLVIESQTVVDTLRALLV